MNGACDKQVPYFWSNPDITRDDLSEKKWPFAFTDGNAVVDGIVSIYAEKMGQPNTIYSQGGGLKSYLAIYGCCLIQFEHTG
ncbi:MAG: hypothetical protein V1897_12455 [Pseudomonadota bacterium]